VTSDDTKLLGTAEYRSLSCCELSPSMSLSSKAWAMKATRLNPPKSAKVPESPRTSNKVVVVSEIISTNKNSTTVAKLKAASVAIKLA